MTRNIEKRLGMIIGIYRKRKVKQGYSDLKQTQFIKTNIKHPFEGVSLDCNVCSLATLSRIENGKHQHDYVLIDYFLKKLDIHYRIKESTYHLEKHHLKSITYAFAYTPINKLMDLMKSCELFYQENQDDVLLTLDHHVFKFINRLFLLKRADRSEYDHLLEIFEVVNPYLQDWITVSGLWLKQVHPDFWDLVISNEKTELLELNQILRNGDGNLMHNQLNPCFKKFHDASWVMHELKVLLANKDHGLIYPHTLSELTHCLGIANQRSNEKIGHSKLFHALHAYVHMNPRAQIKYLSDHLIDLLIHEPYPKPITKLISQNALILCQTQKSYKPLKTSFKAYMYNRIGKFYRLFTCTSVCINNIKETVFSQ